MLSEVGFDKFVTLPLPQRKELLKLFRRRQPLVIFDIGSCEGEDSIRYLKLFPRARIHAFEPVPANYEIAANNIRRFKAARSVKLNQIALSNAAGDAEFYVSHGTPTDIEPKPNWNYGNKSSSLLKPKETLNVVPWLKFKNKARVRTMTLDQYCQQESIAHINLVHMDVQGAELMVLEGSKKMLSNIDAIWMEVEAVELYAGQPLKKEVESFMQKAGFHKFKDTVDSISGDQLYVKNVPRKSRLQLITPRMLKRKRVRPASA